jgi:hypothetical protein
MRTNIILNITEESSHLILYQIFKPFTLHPALFHCIINRLPTIKGLLYALVLKY